MMSERWEPPSLLVVPLRGLVVMGVGVLGLWSYVGGETVTCRGDASAWTCEREPESLFLRVVGLGSDSINGPLGRPKMEISSRRGYYAARVISGATDFRLAAQPSPDVAEADRKAFAAWMAKPRGLLVLSGPARRRDVVVAAGFTLVTALAVAATAWKREGA